MNKLLRRWKRSLSYRATVRELRALSPRELNSLGIQPRQIAHLAAEISRL